MDLDTQIHWHMPVFIKICVSAWFTRFIFIIIIIVYGIFFKTSQRGSNPQISTIFTIDNEDSAIHIINQGTVRRNGVENVV